jgi:hypothetical protein
MTPLVSIGHSIVRPFSIEGFWLPHWYLLVIVLFVPFQLKASDYPFGIIWSYYCLCHCNWRILITLLVSFVHCIVWKGTDNTMTKRYQWCNQKPSIEKGQTILWPKDTNGVIRSLQLKRDRQYYDQNIPMGLSEAFNWKGKDNIMTKRYQWSTPLVSFGHIIVCAIAIEGFWLPYWYLLVIVLSVPFQLKASDYPIGIFWS